MRQRQKAIDGPDERDQAIQQLDLPKAKGGLLQNFSVPPPPGGTDPVKLDYFFDAETGARAGFNQLVPRVSAVMSQDLVEGSIQSGSVRHEDDGAAILLETAANIPEGFDVVLKVFHHVQANDGIKLGLRISFARAGVGVTHLQIGARHLQIVQALEIQLVDVTREVGCARDEIGGQIPDAGTNFPPPPA